MAVFFIWNYAMDLQATAQELVSKLGDSQIELIHDGYHSFKELYEFRKLYNAALFNEWVKTGLYDVHKSERHHDGEKCFGGGWFIVTAQLPSGQISNHYKLDDWELFKCPSFEKSKHEFDGHTPFDVLDRINSLIKTQEV